MKKTILLSMMILALAAMPVLAQDPPTGLAADLDAATGDVDLTWVPPFAADYMEDFEDGEAQGWNYDVDANWSVTGGMLAGEITPVDVQWTGAAYGGMVYNDFTAEAEMTRTAGTASFSQGLFVRATGPYGDVTGYSGFMLNIAPADFGGAFLVVKYVNDVATFVTPAWTDFAGINIGIGSANVVSVTASGSEYTLFINGEEAYAWTDSDLTSGQVGVGFAEDLGVYGRVETDYVAVDDFMQAASGMPTGENVNLPVQDDSYLTQVPARLGRAPEAKVQPNGLLYADGQYQGNNTSELDEFIEWRIYRDGDQVGTATDPMYTDNLPDFGTFEYTVTGFYDEGESAAAGPVAVTWQDPSLFPIDEDFDAGLPDSWSVEGTVATLNWHVDNGDERALFPTPYMLIDSDAPGSCPHIMGRLVTPMVALDNPAAVQLEYDYIFDEYVDEFGYVDWSADGTNWTNIVTYEEADMSGTDVMHDVTDAVMGESEVWFSFMYDDDNQWGWYFAVDNVSVYTDQDGGDDPATLTLTPTTDVVPVGGGDVVFDAHLMTTIPQGYPNVMFWLEVEAPNGQTYGPLNSMTFYLPANADLTATGASLAVPGFAPAGEYDLMGYVGYPNMNVSDGFMFTKEGAATDMAIDPTTWDSNVEFVASDAGEAMNAMPEEFALEQAYPNPFNPTTTVAVALPTAADLTVTVYNIAGQQVAELANGQREAGRHTLVFDATNLSSGIYFVQAHVPGELNQTQKVMLVR